MLSHVESSRVLIFSVLQNIFNHTKGKLVTIVAQIEWHASNFLINAIDKRLV